MVSPLRSPKDAARVLGVSVKTLSCFVSDGEIGYINVGRGKVKRRIMFTEGDLADFIQRRAQRDVPCRSTSTKTARSITSTSNTSVVAFTALRNARTSVTQKPSSVRNETKPSNR